MTPESDLSYLREAVVFLVASVAVVPLFLRLRASPLLGYLAVGVLIGPHGLGRLAEAHSWVAYVAIADTGHVRHFAELGVVFLMFTIGLELSVERLWSIRRAVFGLGAAQVLACGGAIGLLAWTWGNPPQAAVILGACLALSSTAVVFQLLAERGMVVTRLGRTCVGILLFQDLAVAPILALVGLASAQTGSVMAALGLALGKAAAAIGLIALMGRLLLRPVYRRIAALRSPELFVALTLLVVIGTAWASGRAGLSMALGAFLAGLVLAETEFRHQIEAEIAPFKGLLLGLFFISVGMSMDLAVGAAQWLWLALSVLGLFAIKSALIAALCLAFRQPGHVALPAGLLLGQAGEFGFLIVGMALTGGLLPAATGQFMLLLVALTMAATPLAAMAAYRVAAVLRARRESRDMAPDLGELAELEGHVIIAGFGRVGRMVARLLAAQGMRFVALDMDAEAVRQCRQDGLPVYFGDTSRGELLHQVGAGRAAALVVTLGDTQAAGRLLERARREWPALKLYARARDAAHARELRALGADEVVPEAVEASLQLAGRVLEGIGLASEAVADQVERVRAEELAAMIRELPKPDRRRGENG